MSISSLPTDNLLGDSLNEVALFDGFQTGPQSAQGLRLKRDHLGRYCLELAQVNLG